PSNVFFVKDGILVTPALVLGLLEGVTRGLLMEVAKKEGLIVREAFHGPEALAAADEVFLTSTLREIMPITSLVFGTEGAPDPRPVGNGAPGPMAQRLRTAFHALIEEWLREAGPRWQQQLERAREAPR